MLWHLARATPFMPPTLAEQDRALAWLMFEQSEIEPVIGSARFWIQTGRDQARRDELDRRLTWARQTLTLLERELSQRPFLVGDRGSVADLAVYAYTHRAPEIDLPLGPHVAVWRSSGRRADRSSLRPGSRPDIARPPRSSPQPPRTSLLPG